MKRILIYFLLFLALLTFMAYGMSGSGAWFTDQVGLEDNRITTGNIDLVISDVSRSTPMLEPGGDYQELLRFCVKNGGSYNMKWRGMLTDIKAPTGMENQILIQAIINPTQEFAGNYGAFNQTWFTDQPASVLMEANQYLLMDASTNRDPFKPNDRVCYIIQAKLQASVDNTFQLKSFNANLRLDATQWINKNNSWSE